MQRIIFFDGYCPLCNGFIDFVFKIDKNNFFKYASLQSQTALSQLDPTDLSLDSVVYKENERIYTKSTAVLRILFQVGGAYSLLALILAIFPVRLRDFFYTWIAKNRYKFFKKSDSCRLPKPEERDRFLT